MSSEDHAYTTWQHDETLLHKYCYLRVGLKLNLQRTGNLHATFLIDYVKDQ